MHLIPKDAKGMYLMISWGVNGNRGPIHVYFVWQKPTQHCKAIICQLKKKTQRIHDRPSQLGSTFIRNNEVINITYAVVPIHS